MFRRKPNPIIREEPSVRRMMSLEHAAAEQRNAADMMMAEIARYRDGNIRICSDLLLMQTKLEKSRDDMLDMAAKCAADIDFAAKQISKMAECLQGDAPDLEAVISRNPLPNGAGGPSQEEPRAIGFLAKEN